MRALKARNEARGKTVTMPGQAAGQPKEGKKLGGALNDYVCGGGTAQEIWADQQAVREALHVPLDSVGPVQIPRTRLQPKKLCILPPPTLQIRPSTTLQNFFSGDNGDGMTYEVTEPNLMPFYQEVAKNNPDVRVLV